MAIQNSQDTAIRLGKWARSIDYCGDIRYDPIRPVRLSKIRFLRTTPPFSLALAPLRLIQGNCPPPLFYSQGQRPPGCWPGCELGAHLLMQPRYRDNGGSGAVLRRGALMTFLLLISSGP